MRRLFVTGVLCLFQFICLSLAYGQGGRGTINGTVADPSGALIGGAQVTIKNTLTGQVTTVNTTSDGNYSVPFLAIGKYDISASHEGFETQTATNLPLTADQVATENFTLKIGSSSTHVEVEASATQIDTTTGAISDVIDSKSITELPLNGRNPATLVALAPGAIDANQVGGMAIPGNGSGAPTETGASVNGSRVSGVIYQLDGITNMNNYFNTADPFPNPDATQEFRVITNNFDAQYGFTSGAIVSIATRSGTNQWHGAAFEFLRNNVLNSKEYFTQQANPLKRNQFGGSIGGPIIKDKLFIFGNLQITRENVSASNSGTQVPNNAELAGDFSGICNTGFTAGICNDRSSSGGIENQLYKGYVGLGHTVANAYLNNYIDPSTFSTFGTTFEQGLPKTDAANGLVNVLGIPQHNNAYEFTTRADYNISPSQTLSVRFFDYHFFRPTFSGAGNYLAGGGNARSNLAKVMNAEVSHIWTIRPNLVNDLRLGFSTNNTAALTGITAVGGGPLNFAALGSNLNEISNFIGYVTTSGFSVSGIPVVQGRHNWTLNDTVSLTTGKHTITTGFTVYTQYSLEQATWEGDPLVFFDGGAITGNSFADFLLGLPREVDASGGEYNRYTATDYAAFGQDSIKLKPNLSINVGVRWEPQVAPVSVGDHIADYYPGQKSTRFPNAPAGLVFPGDAGVGQGGWNSNWHGFYPRVSVAWSPRMLPNTTIRSAFALQGIPYDYSYYNHQSANAPFSPAYTIDYNQVVASPTCPGGILTIANPFGCYPSTGNVDPFPPFAGPADHPTANVAFALPVTLSAVFTKGFNPGTDETWNLSIQHSIGNDFLLGATYIGHHDYDLPLVLEFSPGIFNCAPVGPNCTQTQFDGNGGTRLLASENFNSVGGYASIGVDSYNAVQLSVEKRFTHGLQFSSNYTYSKLLDMSAQGSFSNVGSLYNPYNPRASYGISDLNTPQIWNNTVVYQTPKLSSMGKVASTLLGSWETSFIWQLHSGRPFSIGGGSNPLSNCGGDNASCADVSSDLADRVSGQSLKVHQGSKAQWIQQYFNPAAFTYNAPGTFGNSGRNIMYAPGWNSADMQFSKNFPFRERYNVQFRWEMFNAFNRTEFNGPSTDYNPSSTGTFGQITSTQCNGAIQCIGGPRVMQAGLKLNF